MKKLRRSFVESEQMGESLRPAHCQYASEDPADIAKEVGVGNAVEETMSRWVKWFRSVNFCALCNHSDSFPPVSS